MNPVELQRDVRAAIAMAYELSRHEQILQKVHIAAALADLEFELTRIEAKLGGPEVATVVPSSLSRFLAEVSSVVADAGNVVAAQIDTLLASVRDIQRRLARALPSRNIVSRPVLGALPLARILPQDLHTAGDVVIGLGALAALVFASSGRARSVGAVIGLGALGAALFSDHRLGAKKLISIERHHAIDCALGAAAIAAPFALGYGKKDPVAAAIHVGLGATLLASAALTDYRAAVGLGHEADDEADPEYATG
jgi:hypothetical protein